MEHYGKPQYLIKKWKGNPLSNAPGNPKAILIVQNLLKKFNENK